MCVSSLRWRDVSWRNVCQKERRGEKRKGCGELVHCAYCTVAAGDCEIARQSTTRKHDQNWITNIFSGVIDIIKSLGLECLG